MPLLIFLGLIFHALWIRIWGPSSEPPSPLAELTEALEKALILIVEGEHQRAATILDSVGTPASRIRGEDGRILRARHGLLVGELLGLMDRRGEALASYGRVRAELEKLPHGDPRNFDLEICADLGRGLLVTAAGATTEDVAAGERAIGREAEVKRPDTLMKMTRLAHWLGMVHQNGGRWEQARVHYEHAVKISERVHPPGGVGLDFSWSPAARLLFWAEARSMASAAAIELGLTLLSLGESDSGRAWLERAVSILEGPETASVQVQRAKALLVLAQQGFRDGIEDEVTRESLLERAVGAGLKSNATTGRIFACQAEIGRGLLDGDRGMSEAAAVHYRRAAGYLEGISDSNADEFAAQALLTLGLELAGAGAVGEAMDAFRQALARGRESTDYDARRHAAVAAYYLHRMLLSQDHPGDGGPVLDVLNALVPTLAANVRPLFVAFASRSRGWQHVIEKRPDEARREFEAAESRSRLVGTPEGWNLARQVASDLGTVAVGAGQFREAVEHFERAAAIPLGQKASGHEQADLAEVEMRLGRALIEVDREGEAREILQRALDRGRDSGVAAGRETAAVTAMVMGDRADVATGQRRRWYELAASLGQTSGRPMGRQVADAVTERLREMAE